MIIFDDMTWLRNVDILHDIISRHKKCTTAVLWQSDMIVAYNEEYTFHKVGWYLYN